MTVDEKKGNDIDKNEHVDDEKNLTDGFHLLIDALKLNDIKTVSMAMDQSRAKSLMTKLSKLALS